MAAAAVAAAMWQLQLAALVAVDANPLFGHGVAGHKHWFPRY